MARPREFDTDAALDGAMQVFWRNGYAGTSVDDVAAALGIVKPSLYAAFGNKRELFERALDRYAAHSNAKLAAALAEPTALAVARSYLVGLVERPASAPAGCLMVKSAVGSADDVKAAVAARMQDAEKLFATRLSRAQKEGDLPPDVRPADLARFLTTTTYGLAVQGAAGATQAQQRRVIDVALRVFAKA